MKKIRVPAGTAQKFETVFDSLQDFTKTNFDQRLDRTFKSYGLDVEFKNNLVTSSDWEISILDSLIRRVQVNVGSDGKAIGIVDSIEPIWLDQLYAFNLVGPDPSKPYCVISASWESVQSNPLPVINGFLYDPTGEANTINTVVNDQTKLRVSKYATADAAMDAVMNHVAYKIPLAVVKVISGSPEMTLTTDDWSSEYTGTLDITINNGVIDTRKYFVAQLKDNAIDDTKVLFKDRDSTEATNNPVDGKVTFKDRVHLAEDLTLSTDKSIGIGFAETDDISEFFQVYIKGGQNRGTMRIEQTATDWASKLFLKNVTNEYMIVSDANPNQLRIGRGNTALTGEADLVIDSSGEVTVAESFTASSSVLHSSTTHLADNTTVASGKKLGVGYAEGDTLSYPFQVRAGAGALLIESTTADTDVQTTFLGATTSSYAVRLSAETNVFGIGRAQFPANDLYIDSSGDVTISNNLTVNQTAHLSVGQLIVNDNLITSSTNAAIILGDNVDNLTPDNYSTNVYYQNREAVLKIISDAGASPKSLIFSSNGLTDSASIVTSSDLTFRNDSGASLLKLDISAQTAEAFKLKVVQGTINSDAIEIGKGEKIVWKTTSSTNPSVSSYKQDGSGLGIGVNIDYSGESMLTSVQDATKPTSAIQVGGNSSGASIGFYLADENSGGTLNDTDEVLTINTTQILSRKWLHVRGGNTNNYISDSENTSFIKHLLSTDITASDVTSGDITIADSLEVENALTVNSGIIEASVGLYGTDMFLSSMETNASSLGAASASSISVLDSLDVGTSSITQNGNTASMVEIVGSGLHVNGQTLQTAPGVPTSPTNFRVWDAYPTSNKNEKAGYIHLKWNYGDLGFASGYAPVDGASTARFETNTVNSTGETFNETTANNIVGKTLVIFPHLNEYAITDYDTSTKEVTINGTFDADDPDYDYVRIVDRDADSYILKVIQLVETSTNVWEESALSETFVLDEDFINSSSYVIKLELDQRWKFKLKSKNSAYSSAYTTMSDGSYDPDHDFDSSDTVSYTGDYDHSLPVIDSTASLSLTSTSLGFNISVAGDAWQVTADAQNSAHEYEIIYSETEDPSFNNFSDVHHLFTSNTFVPISANAPKRWYVKARAIQNTVPVSSGVYSNIVGGGGGIPPGDQIIVQMPVDITVASGTVTVDGGTGAVTVDSYDTEGNSCTMGNGEQTGNSWVITDSTGSTTKGTTQVNSHTTNFS